MAEDGEHGDAEQVVAGGESVFHFRRRLVGLGTGDDPVLDGRVELATYIGAEVSVENDGLRNRCRRS